VPLADPSARVSVLTGGGFTHEPDHRAYVRHAGAIPLAPTKQSVLCDLDSGRLQALMVLPDRAEAAEATGIHKALEFVAEAPPRTSGRGHDLG